MLSNQVSLHYEKELWQQGITNVAGVDEAGRGPLAGPVVAAAVVFAPETEPITAINDSKRLTSKQREKLYPAIIDSAVAVGIGLVEAEEIDRINILQATYKAMRQAIGRLRLKVGHILIDGRPLPDKIYPQTAIVGGDRICYSIAAASIIAKVYRDQLMQVYDSVFPGYGFAQHKGYGTAAHLKAIIQLKPCPIHRRSFTGVKEHLLDLTSVKNSRFWGKYGEDLAALHLHRQGYQILERNFHLGAYGELDIIARQDDCLCFVEVKTQRHKKFGDPVSWVDEQKVKQLHLLAEGYLSQHPELQLACRFDVIGVNLTGTVPEIVHLKDAFRW